MQDRNILNNEPDLTVVQAEENKKEVKKVNVIACKSCQAINLPLIKATDSYYCKFCFNKLGKKKFQKKGRK